MDRLDARYRIFKEKIRKLGYIKDQAKKVNNVMEVIADFGMMSDAGNKKVARAVAQSKNEKELKSKLEKISRMAGGKYSEASDDDVVQTAMDAMDSKGAKGMQLRPEADVLMQLKGMEDTKRDTDVRTDDMKKTKVKWKDAVKVKNALLYLKPQPRSKYLRLLRKDQKSFKKTFNAILRVA